MPFPSLKGPGRSVSARHFNGMSQGPLNKAPSTRHGPSGPAGSQRKDFKMVKVEGFPQYGKEQFEAAVASANNVQQGFKAIATAWGDYAKRSFQDGNA